MKNYSQALSFIAAVVVCASGILTVGCDTGSVEAENIQVYFSSQDACDIKVASLIDGAERELNIALYSFNRKIIADAVLNAFKRNVSVRLVVDGDQAESAASKDEYLEAAGISVKRDKHPGYGAMHHKFAVIDGRTVITGSYNWTTNATTNNDENMIVINSRNTAGAYNQEFERLWAHAGF
ncbi:MAG: phospholipase D-like domain-containing protein [Treponema sp.]|jgi:phosphatidylserine/phosphatidylglycerophosphate/cardiolipin synthase-like enzyme|nr:phospholipase D-like domain-containing protein [Treponema sp.]